MSLKLLDAVTATGAGDSKALSSPTSMFTCTVTWGGTAPTNIVIYFEGSEDGTNFATLADVTITSSPTIFHVLDKLVNHVRGNYVSKTGGDGTTSVTITCTAAPGR